MTTLPLIFSREPSSLASRNVCSPAVATVRFAKTCDWKLLLAPNCSVVVQSMVDMTLSTFGVVPLLIVHSSFGAVPSW